MAGEGDNEAEQRGGRGRRFGGNGVGDAASARSPPLILGGFFLETTHEHVHAHDRGETQPPAYNTRTRPAYNSTRAGADS